MEVDDLPNILSISIELFIGETVLIYIAPTDTIENLKTKIKERRLYLENIPTYDMQISLDEKKLKDEKTVSESNVKDNSNLALTWKTSVYVNFFNKYGLSGTKIHIKTNDTIKDIKMKAWNKDDPIQQRLYIVGEESPRRQLNDLKKLSQYNLPKILREGLVLRICSLEIQIKLLKSEVIATFWAEPSDSTDDIKAMIEDILGVPEYVQRLAFSGRLLQ